MGNTGALTIALAPQRTQTASNLGRWLDLLHDPVLAKIEGRIETDRHGRVVLGGIPPVRHGMYQAQVGILLHDHMCGGVVLTVCPICTADGVRLADVAWASPECMRELGTLSCFPRAPDLRGSAFAWKHRCGDPREDCALLRCRRPRSVALLDLRCHDVSRCRRKRAALRFTALPELSQGSAITVKRRVGRTPDDFNGHGKVSDFSDDGIHG